MHNASSAWLAVLDVGRGKVTCGILVLYHRQRCERDLQRPMLLYEVNVESWAPIFSLQL